MRSRVIVVLFGLMFMFAGCSTQRNLNMDFKGKTQEELMLAMGRATRVEDLGSGRKINIYEKSKFLKPAAINTGQFQYDKFESPKALKTEVYMFYINAQGVIEDVKYDVKYER
jgi:hypothetical protein